MARKKARAPQPPTFERVEFETYQEPDAWALGVLKKDSPSCFNGIIRVRRYRVIVERIEEPDSVIAARLQSLWDVCDNYHNCAPLIEEAARIGYTLEGRMGRFEREGDR